MGKTIRQLIEEERAKSGAKQYSGHDIMDLMRFDEHTRHMIVYDVIGSSGSLGMKGERGRLFLTEQGYQKALERADAGDIKILNHAKVSKGNLSYNRKDQVL